MSPTNQIIQYKNLSYQVDNRVLLNITKFPILEKSCIALSGKNGSGKSTLMRIMAGLLAPEEAIIDYQNNSYCWLDARKLIRNQVMYLHQNPYLFDRTVRDNIAYGLNSLGINKDSINERVNFMLNWANLEHLAERNAHLLSGGEKQRVAFARAQILSPKILLLDEPTANMDKHAKEQTWKMVERLLEEDLSVIIATHEYNSISHLCDQYMYLDSGELHSRKNQNLKEI